MVQEIIDSIVEAENQAEIIVKEANAKAKETVTKANSAAEDAIADAKEKAKSEAKKNLEKARKKADEEYADAVAANAKKIEALGKTAGKNLDKAAEVVIGRLKERYARS